MTLKDNWQAVLKKAWSIKLLAVSMLLSGVEFVFPIFMEAPPMPRGAFAALAFTSSVAAAIARLLTQSDLKD